MPDEPAASAGALPPALPFPYSGPDELRAPLLAALRRVIDPEVALSIVDVGLIYGVTISATTARLCLTMTSAACPVADLIIDELDLALDRVLPAHLQLEIEMCWEPPWTPALMTERARSLMQW